MSCWKGAGVRGKTQAMLTSVQAGPYTIRGLSVAGIYTALYVPELAVALDVGLAPRSFAGAKALFLSHGHVDHVGAIASMLGIRALTGVRPPLRVFMPTEIVTDLSTALAAHGRMQGFELAIDAVGMEPGAERQLHGDLFVRAHRSYHPVPALAYQFFRRVDKLRPQFIDLPGEEIARRRQAGDRTLFESVERLELAYATDTSSELLSREPSLLQSQVLVLECTFLDDRKSLASSHAGGHTHLNDLLPFAESFANERIVLVHFSQIYKPSEISAILDARCPASLRERIVPLVPPTSVWPG